MPVTYGKAGSQVFQHLNEVLNKNYQSLAELNVSVGVYFASNEDGAAIVDGNDFPLTGKIKVNTSLDRVKTGFDADLLLDQGIWFASTEERREAILDHYLYQLQLVPNTDKQIAEGAPLWKEDDLGRPKLRLRKGDWNSGSGFKEIVKRHGDNAVEFLHLEQAYEKAKKAKED